MVRYCVSDDAPTQILSAAIHQMDESALLVEFSKVLEKSGKVDLLLEDLSD